MTIKYPPYQYLKFEILGLFVRALNMFSPTKIVMLKNCIQLTGLKIAKNVVDQEKRASIVNHAWVIVTISLQLFLR